MEPYYRSGRGGAGNFFSKQEIEEASKAAIVNDPEAQSPTPFTPQSINDLTRTTTTSSTLPPAPEYQLTGRGGAGNFYQPTALKSQGLSQADSPNSTSTSNSTPSSLSSPTTSSSAFPTKSRPNPTSTIALGQSKPTYRGGRGGAGNYVDFAADARERKERERAEEERVRKEVERMVERDVESGLARPGRTYAGVGLGGVGGSGGGGGKEKVWEMGDM